MRTVFWWAVIFFALTGYGCLMQVTPEVYGPQALVASGGADAALATFYGCGLLLVWAVGRVVQKVGYGGSYSDLPLLATMFGAIVIIVGNLHVFRVHELLGAYVVFAGMEATCVSVFWLGLSSPRREVTANTVDTNSPEPDGFSASAVH